MSQVKEETIVFNIIYVRDTVAALLPLLRTLMSHSACQYRLVSNGCTEEEEELLSTFASADERLSFHSLEATRILQHHEALHSLMDYDDGPCFAFMDSDIFATAGFISHFIAALQEHDGVFTGLPIWHEEDDGVMPAQFQIAGGRFYKSHNDLTLGLTYCAIYKKEPLRAYMQRSGMDLGRYYWRELKPAHQEKLTALGLRKNYYDTAKVLNVLWEAEGAKLCYKEISSLIHLGGISGEAYQKQVTLTLKARLTAILPDGLISRLRALLWRKSGLSYREVLDLERLIRKRAVSRQLLQQQAQYQASQLPAHLTKGLSPRFLREIEAVARQVAALSEEVESSKPSQTHE